VFHTSVEGATGYVVVTGTNVEVACEGQVPNLCRATFSSAPGCVTMKATDGARRSAPSNEFCVGALGER
jgi:hypothetical protein